MKKTTLSLGLLALFGIGAQAATISLNFVRGSNGVTPLDATDVAGVVAVDNWNNVAQAEANLRTTAFALNDDGGLSSGATATWDSGGASWSTGTAGTGGAGDMKMMTGYLDQSGTGVGQVHEVDFIDIPYAQYDVYLYHLGGANRSAKYTANGVDLFTRNVATNGIFNGFEQDQHATQALSNASATGGNYVKWSGLTASTLEIRGLGIHSSAGGYVDSDHTRSPIQGIQIVQVPEPSASVAIGLLGGMLVLFRRRR